MFLPLWHKNVPTTPPVRPARTRMVRFRPLVERLESRDVPSLVVGSNVNMSRLPASQAEASLAINPTNPNNLVAFSNDDGVSSGIRVYRSTDAGATWSSRVITNGDGLGVRGCCDGETAFDAFGNLFLTYIDFTGGNADAVKVLRSTDGGASFTLQATVASSSSGSLDQPNIATGAGSVWVSFNNGTQIEAHGASVTGLGAVGAFGPAELLPGSSGGSFGGISVGPSGQVLATYQAPSGGTGPSTIFVNLDTDGLGPNGFGNAVTASATNVGGFDRIPPQQRRSIDAEANLAYDRSGGPHNGRVYLVYTDATTVGSADTDIYARYSDNNGQTWSARQRVNDDSTTNSQFLPSLAVDQTTGNLAVAFYDSRNAAGGVKGGDQTAQVFATVSQDGGVSFQPNVQVSVGTSNSQTASSSTDYGDFMTMDFCANSFYPIWSDNSTALGGNPDLPNLDIATARVSLPGAHFVVTPSVSSTTAGVPFSITVTAQDASGHTLTNYTGTVHFTSSDPQATLPADYPFTPADQGTHTFTNLVTLRTAGNQTITATDTTNNSITGSAAVAVTPAAANRLQVVAPTSAGVGTPFSVTVTARDAFNNVATGYTGTIHFTSSDGSATLPANYPFLSSDHGSHTFTNGVTLRTPGPESITATDTVTSSITGSATVTVSAVTARFVLAAPTSWTSGSAFTVRVTATDANGNTLTNYTGTVHWTSSDAQATLPSNYTFSIKEGGIHVFTVTLRTLGNQTITVTDVNNGAMTGSATVMVTSGKLSPQGAGKAPAKPAAPPPLVLRPGQPTEWLPAAGSRGSTPHLALGAAGGRAGRDVYFAALAPQGHTEEYGRVSPLNLRAGEDWGSAWDQVAGFPKGWV
jgi:hypothetical protein